MLQEIPALCQCHRVGVDFGQCAPVFSGQAHDAVADAQFVFSDNRCPAVSEQLVIVKEASGNRVFNGNHSDDAAVFPKGVEHVFERVAANQFDFLVLENLWAAMSWYEPGTPCMAIFSSCEL